MSELRTPEGPRRLLTELCRLVAERAAVEQQARAEWAARNEAAEKEFQKALESSAERYRTRKATVEQEYVSTRSATETQFRTEHDAAQREFESARAEALAAAEADQQAAQQELQDAHWEAMESADAARGGLNLPLKELLAGLESRWQQLETVHKQAVELLERRGHWRDLPELPPVNTLLERHPGRRFCHALEQSQAQWRALSRQFLPKLFQGWRPYGIFVLIWLLAASPLLALFKVFDWWQWEHWAAISGGATVLVALVAGIWIYRIARRKSVEAYLALRRTMLEAGVGHAFVLETAKSDCQRLDATIIARHQSQTKKADEVFAAATTQIENRRQNELQRIDDVYPKRLAELAEWHQRTLRETEEKYPPLLRQIDEQYAAQSEQIHAARQRAVQESQERFDRQWTGMADRWRSGVERFRQAAAEADEECRRAFPDWNTDDWRRWTLPGAMPGTVLLGTSSVKLSDIDRGVPEDESLRPAQTDFTLPVFLPFPRRSLLLLKAAGPGRATAVDLMQSAMLRMLTSLPPGKVRFTIIDPVGLGDNFSAFMHLADFDEQLVASRIWTDSSHIEQRLADLTKHMENVIQVYLRQEFHSIEEYNAFAGELAEPYRVLVVANFPANFTEASVHRIKSIVASGARCGVFVMMSVDTKAPAPRNCQLPDLESEGLALHWADDHFAAEHPDFGPLAVRFESPPPVERFKEIVRAVGAAARDLGRVEVPFPCVVPEESQWWTSDSRAEIDVPLGRAGAMKLQRLNLGHGTSQHVLVSGKTGSGKSTLLHVLITNLALRYSPDEVELYLVDFKKGVEFKAYARAMLPHARVVAIESEREFGLSVLQRLDAELRTRGDLLRQRGIQDIKTYRTAVPDARLPRILLIIDEFQELFTEDDRISQESALLLDRLVRQGRAFGIHVLLGSQTLGGAYTLARSTIGQMAVRIALQCSEADAHLILSEDNTAARLLTRPGEAIYNDANGLYEGNHPFQIVWLPDTLRDDYLKQIRRLAHERHCSPPPIIVFEGNILADIADNPLLKNLIAADRWPDRSPATSAWLGSAVAIKDPTSAVFLRQNGSNLLIVGHREEAALGVLAACLVSLAAQGSPLPLGEGTGAKFYILDGMRADAPEFGFWTRLAETVPQEVKIAGVREAPAIMEEIAAELAARQHDGHDHGPPVYLLLYNLGRFRDLRKEDDFGFSGGSDGSPSAAKQFATILREGPPLGVHTAVWCDTYSNVTRMLDRQSMQDFEMRVLFQMNGNDSSSLMDSPEASRLGVHRAILYDEGQGLVEKFRPYGLPSNEFLAWVKKQLCGR
jgi:DNA segregation ATPase FtsK/SpoIIIE, S-DNA-T family